MGHNLLCHEKDPCGRNHVYAISHIYFLLNGLLVIVSSLLSLNIGSPRFIPYDMGFPQRALRGQAGQCVCQLISTGAIHPPVASVLST